MNFFTQIFNSFKYRSSLNFFFNIFFFKQMLSLNLTSSLIPFYFLPFKNLKIKFLKSSYYNNIFYIFTLIQFIILFLGFFLFF